MTTTAARDRSRADAESDRVLDAIRTLPGEAMLADDPAEVLRAALGPEHRVFGWGALFPTRHYVNGAWVDAEPVWWPHLAWHGPGGWAAVALPTAGPHHSWFTSPWYVRTQMLCDAVLRNVWGPHPDLAQMLMSEIEWTGPTAAAESWTEDAKRAMLCGLSAPLTVRQRAGLATWLALGHPELLTDPHGCLAAVSGAGEKTVWEFLPDGAVRELAVVRLPHPVVA